MPAVTVDDVLVLPALATAAPDAVRRPALDVVHAVPSMDGAGVKLRRVFPQTGDMARFDPFLLFDHLGPTTYGANQAAGFPDHPHRGFETVTYMIDGEIEHRDSHGGGGVIGGGDTQWMTAGAGLVHSEMPTEALFRSGGLFHGFQLWVNLPAAQKMVPPSYQDLSRDRLTLARSADGGAFVRVIAGSLAGVDGPGATRTPIVYAHATVQPGAQLEVPWDPAFNALAYTFGGSGRVGGATSTPVADGVLVLLGAGDVVSAQADEPTADGRPLELLLFGGQPIREPISHYGPFVMNTRAEILQAVEDYQAGRLGTIPAR